MAEGTIGGVGVSVVPDATDFWRRFVEQTRPGAVRAGAELGTDVRRGMQAELDRGVSVRADTTLLNRQIGDIGARLRAAGSEFRIDPSGLSAAQLASVTGAANRLADAEEKVAAARRNLEEVSRREGATEEEVAAATRTLTRAQRDQEQSALRLAASEEAVAAAQRRQADAALKAAGANESVDASAKNASSGGLSKLILAAAALAPALIPIGAVAIPAIATLALGAKRAGQEIKHGLTDEFQDLQRAAGRSLTPGVESLVHSLQQAQPQLRQLIGVFGGAISDELTKLSNALDNGGLKSFIAYAKQELPVVEHAFNSILGAVVDIGKAVAPLGDTLVRDVDQIAQLTSGIVGFLEKLNDARNQVNDLRIPGGSSGALQQIAKGNLPFALDQINKGLEVATATLDHFLGAGSTGAIVGHANAVADAMNKEAAAFDNTAKELRNYDAKIAAHISKRVAAVQAENSFIIAARGVADAVKANGRTLDAATAAGQQNRDALIGAASAALKFYDAQIKSGVASATAAQDLAGNVKQLELTATHAGLAKGPVDGLLKSLGLFPPTITTKFVVDISQALAQLAAYNNALSVIPGMGVVSVALAAAIAGAQAQAQSSAKAIKTGTGGVIPGTPGIATPTPSTVPAGPTPVQLAGTLSSFRQSVLGTVVNPITAAFNQLIQSLRSSGVDLSSSFVSYLRNQDDQLRQTAAERAKVERQLQRATQHVDNLLSARASLESSVRGATRGSFDITTAGTQGAQFGEPVTLFDIQSQLQQALRNANRFEHVVKRLAREGLNKHLIAQLAEAGPAALPQAVALLSATPKQLAAINSEYRQLGDTGKDLGKFVGNDLYKAGIQAAEGLVKGLKSKESALTATMRHLADVMVAELRRALDMHSPSRRLFNEGALAFEGYRLGIESKAGDVATAAGFVAGKALGNRSAYKFDGLTHRGGGTLVGGDFVNHQHFDRPVPEPASRSANAAMRAARNALGA